MRAMKRKEQIKSKIDRSNVRNTNDKGIHLLYSGSANPAI